MHSNDSTSRLMHSYQLADYMNIRNLWTVSWNQLAIIVSNITPIEKIIFAICKQRPDSRSYSNSESSSASEWPNRKTLLWIRMEKWKKKLLNTVQTSKYWTLKHGSAEVDRLLHHSPLMVISPCLVPLSHATPDSNANRAVFGIDWLSLSKKSLLPMH